MKFIHCSDFHFGIYKYGKMNPKTGLNTRFEQDLQVFDKIIDFAICHKIDYLFMTGDTFNNRKPESIVRYNVVKRLKRLSENGISVILLMSNHDNVKTKDDTHCLSSEDLLIDKNIKIIDKCVAFKTYYNNEYIICLPYYDEFKIEDFMGNVIVLGHFAINGAKNGNYIFSNIDGAINPRVFEHPAIVYVGLGHLHEHQVIKNVVYAGSPYQINFNNINTKCGFIFGDTDLKEYKFIEIPNTRIFVEFDLTYKKGLKSTLDKVDLKNNIVKINLKITHESQYMYINRIKNYLIRHGAIVDSINIKRDISKNVRDNRYKSSNSEIDLLKLYLKGKDEKVIQTGIDILGGIKDGAY